MINILFNIDKNYIIHCQTVMNSIIANTTSKVCFHIVGTENFKCDYFCKFYPKPDMTGFNFVPVGHLTEAICYRLFAPFILKDVDKVIYLDCDTIVLDDIKKLYDYDVQYIAGCIDPLWKYQADKNNLKHLYINSGVMLLNLANLRKTDYFNKIKSTQNGNYNLSLFDQDIINIAFSDVIEHLPERWNVYSKIYRQSTNAMIEARQNPAIIHWCGPAKPFNDENVWMCEKFKQYERS